MRTSRTGSSMFCTATVSVQSLPSGLPTANAVVSFRWSALLARSGWPYSGISAASTAAGMVSVTTASRLPAERGNGCTFTVTGVSAPALTYISASSVTAASASWP